jgi:hypothetical protein
VKNESRYETIDGSRSKMVLVARQRTRQCNTRNGGNGKRGFTRYKYMLR